MRLLLLVTGTLLTLSAHATLVGVSGPDSSLGGSAGIIGAPADVTDDAPGAENIAQQGFDERQNVLLGSDLGVDDGSVAGGTRVDSHMIFINTAGEVQVEHFNVLWEFSGEILGVMSDRGGTLEDNSTPTLGAPGTVYPASPYDARGLEISSGWLGDFCSLDVEDCYSVSGNQLTLSTKATEPGDWIRVVTRSVPEPAPLLLMAVACLGLGLTRRKTG
jgi:hypothetical protein